MKRIIITGLLILLAAAMLLAVPPCPKAYDQDDQSFSGSSEIFSTTGIRGISSLPDSILVLRCQFSDVSFDLDPTYPPGNPDDIPHDYDYFQRLLFHLSTYWKDVSRGDYPLETEDFHLLPQIYTLSKPMAYYGSDDSTAVYISEMIVELLDLADPDVDFSQYDSYIIFHAGAGQEADISGQNTADIWTTFVNRKTLQAGIDEDNDDFPGLLYDGKYLKEFIIAPETERQPDIQEADPVFGLLGVLCHEFGRQMGLPTLYDNDSSDSKSAGIGNYGVMGTGLWNAAGFVPPLPCAFSRIFLGWEDENLIEINEANADIELMSPLQAVDSTKTICKININEDEYFLLENRRQNIDGSSFINSDGDTLATFTFQIVENQEYYPPDHPYAGQPFFNFMENTYEGCEWDFYLPGYGEGDDLDYDGSGICIWHVDEKVFREKFNPLEEINFPNGNEKHKAVDLEEADHVQNMDDYGFYGSRFDTYRQGNNNYFGYKEYNGLPWVPTAESYYGGIQLEVYDISPADSIMSFSVDYGWSLSSGSIGESSLPAAFLQIDESIPRLFFPMPDGQLTMWENDTLFAQKTLLANSAQHAWSWDENRNKIIMPCQSFSVAQLYFLDDQLNYHPPQLFVDYEWAAPVLILEDIYILPLNSLNLENSRLTIIDADSSYTEIFNLPLNGWKIAANLISYEQKLLIPAKSGSQNAIICLDLDTKEHQIHEYETSIDLNPVYALCSRNSAQDFSRIIITTRENKALSFKWYDEGENISFLMEIDLPFPASSFPTLADIDQNGEPEYLIGAENSFLNISFSGKIRQPASQLTAPDSAGIMAGVVPVQINGKTAVAGLMSQNRLCVWEDIAANSFEMLRGYPLSYATRGRNYPLFLDGLLYFTGDNGRVFRNENLILETQQLPVKFANLQRTAYLSYDETPNSYETASIFVHDETYVHPNPYSTIYNGSITGTGFQSGMVAVRVMLSHSKEVKLQLYDIAGNRIDSRTANVNAYEPYDFLINAQNLASGVYFARLKADGRYKLLKFGIEK